MPVSQPKIERTTPDFMGIGYGNLWTELSGSYASIVAKNLCIGIYYLPPSTHLSLSPTQHTYADLLRRSNTGQLSIKEIIFAVPGK